MSSSEIPVGATASASSPASTITQATWATWLAELTSAQLRNVLALLIVRGPPEAIPDEYQQQALELGPQVAGLVAVQESEARAAPFAPPLARAPAGQLYYSAGGATYRLVPNKAIEASLELNLAGAVVVEPLPLAFGTPWQAGATPSSAFADVGRLIAASGDVPAAFRFAGIWRTAIEAES